MRNRLTGHIWSRGAKACGFADGPGGNWTVSHAAAHGSSCESGQTTGVWHLSFDEMDVVLDYIRCGIDAYKRKYEEGKDDVSENQ